MGLPEHIGWVQEGKEVVFSLRNHEREPMADIVCMPFPIVRYDGYWSKLRTLKTSKPMIVDNKKLIVLDVIGSSFQTPSASINEIVKEFYLKMGGKLDDEWPYGVAFKKYKDIKRWQKSSHLYTTWNLCISSSIAFVKECQTQAFNFRQATDLLKGIFDDIYLNVDDPWAEDIMKYWEKHPRDRETGRFYVYSPSSNNATLKKFLEWHKTLKS